MSFSYETVAYRSWSLDPLLFGNVYQMCPASMPTGPRELAYASV